MELGDTIVDEAGEALGVVQVGATLERAEADMALRESHEDGAARGGGLVIAVQLFARFNQAEGLGRVDAKRFEIGRREDFAHAALEGEPSVALARPGGLAGALGAEVEQAARAVSHLCVEKSAAISQLGIVRAELVAVIPHGQWPGQVARQRIESQKVAEPLGIVEIAEADGVCPATVAKAQHSGRKMGWFYRICEMICQRKKRGRGGGFAQHPFIFDLISATCATGLRECMAGL